MASDQHLLPTPRIGASSAHRRFSRQKCCTMHQRPLRRAAPQHPGWLLDGRSGPFASSLTKGGLPSFATCANRSCQDVGSRHSCGFETRILAAPPQGGLEPIPTDTAVRANVRLSQEVSRNWLWAIFQRNEQIFDHSFVLETKHSICVHFWRCG